MSQELWKQKVDLFRRRFGAREDIFTVKYSYTTQEIDPETGTPQAKEISTFTTQCDNYGNPQLCQIVQHKGGCKTCANRKPSHLSDAWIWKHISGEKDLILHMLQEGGIKFGACDFDVGDPFEDALLVKNYSSQKLGLPSYIARSSKKGYHLYWFFSEVVPAHFFTSMVRHIFKEVGILSRSIENPTISIPEVFPKQAAFDAAKIGNGIKIPMIQPKMKEGFNCWVNDNREPYPTTDEQWEFFKNCREVSKTQLEEVIKEHQIEIRMAPVSRSAKEHTKKVGPNGEVSSDYKPYKRGDFQQVINHCPALKQFWEKDEDGSYKFDKTANKNGTPHNARLASMLLAMSTTNGIDMVKERWNSDKTEYYIKHAEDQGYLPVTCGWMQERGLCRMGIHPALASTEGKPNDHCLKKSPPRERINGMELVNPEGLPESEWQDPSPIRFATAKEQLTYEQITERVSRLHSQNPKPTNIEEQVQDILRSAKRLSASDYQRIQDQVKAHNLTSAKELKKIEKEVVKELKNEELAAKRKQAPLSFQHANESFFIEDGRYVRHYSDAKGNEHEKDLTNFVVFLKEEVIKYHGIDETETRREVTMKHEKVKGEIQVNGLTYPFGVAIAEWQRGPESFFSILRQHTGGEIIYKRADYDYIRTCVEQFSLPTKIYRKKAEEVGQFIINRQRCYMMPGVIVTKDSIGPNEEFEIEFDSDSTKDLDFKVIGEEQFKDLALHIINDYFVCNNSIATMTSFAHAMCAAILPQLPLKKSPILFISGNQGNGKTFVGEIAQCFFGPFKDFTRTSASGGGKIELAMQFRHSLLLIDDFKATLEAWGAKSTLELIQQVYDRSGSPKLKRDGSLRERVVKARGLVLFTGQDVPTQEDSAVTRMIPISIHKGINRVHGERVNARRTEYCGFTPHFIQYVFNLRGEAIAQIYKEHVQGFQIIKNGEEELDGSLRVAENLAMNMTAFQLAMEMLYAKGVVDVQRMEDLCHQHKKNLEIIRTEIFSLVRSQKGVAVYLDTLRELLQNPAHYHIANCPGQIGVPRDSSEMLGFYKDSEPDRVYLIMGNSHRAVDAELRKSSLKLQPAKSIGHQLLTEGYIPAGVLVDNSDSNKARQSRTPEGKFVRCWILKLEVLGIDPPKGGNKIQLISNPSSDSHNEKANSA